MKSCYQFLKKLRLHRPAYFLYLGWLNLLNRINFAYNLNFKKGGRVVLYHRIASISNDPQSLCVSAEIFEKHLKYFKDKYELVSLSEICKRSSVGSLSGREMSITFDDGYKDNLDNALPLLEKYQIPATIFVTTGNLGEKSAFAWDDEYSESDRGVFMSKEEILDISKNPLVTIGAHTCTHKNLAGIDLSSQKDEIQNSRTVLEGIINKDVKQFAVPFGGPLSYTAKTLKILKDEGFDIACTTSENLVTANTNHLKMPRFNMISYTTQELADKLK